MPASPAPQAAVAAVQRRDAAAAELVQLVGAVRAALVLLVHAVPGSVQQCSDSSTGLQGAWQQLQQLQLTTTATQRRRVQRRRAALRSAGENDKKIGDAVIARHQMNREIENSRTRGLEDSRTRRLEPGFSRSARRMRTGRPRGRM